MIKSIQHFQTEGVKKLEDIFVSYVFNTIPTNQKNCIPKESHLGVVENNKYSYIKISQLILTGSTGKSALLIPTTNLHYPFLNIIWTNANKASKIYYRKGDNEAII